MPGSNGAKDSKKLLAEALKLTPSVRAAFADRLYASLGFDPAIVKAWEREAARRFREIERGAVKAIPWSEARKQAFTRRLKKA